MTWSDLVASVEDKLQNGTLETRKVVEEYLGQGHHEGLCCGRCQGNPGELGVVVHTWNPSTWEAESGGSQVQGQPQ